jgi:uncharacterized protein (DUF2384 family)
MRQIINLLTNYFDGDDAQVADWLTTPNGSLGGETPMEMIKQDRGYEVLLLVQATLQQS